MKISLRFRPYRHRRLATAWLVASLSLFGGWSCSSLSKGYAHRIGKEAVQDSVFAYGYALIGRQTVFAIELENKTTGEPKTYFRRFADIDLYQEHPFAFSLPAGIWRLKRVSAEGRRLGGFSLEVNREFAVQPGGGSFLGKFGSAHGENPVFPVEEEQRRRDKAEVDTIMAKVFPGFLSDVTRDALIY